MPGLHAHLGWSGDEATFGVIGLASLAAGVLEPLRPSRITDPATATGAPEVGCFNSTEQVGGVDGKTWMGGRWERWLGSNRQGSTATN